MNSLILEHRLALNRSKASIEEMSEQTEIETKQSKTIGIIEEENEEDTNNQAVEDSRAATSSPNPVDGDVSRSATHDGVRSFLKFSIQNILQQHAAATNR